MDRSELANLRRDDAGKPLTKGAVDRDPFVQFGIWLDEALTAEITDANAMTLATADADCRPTSRVVLLKAFSEDGFVFFTNYESQKGRALTANPNASLSFFWPQLHRQVIITGTATRISREESENYFKSRPYESQLGAWASAQSSTIASRAELDAKFEEMRQRFGSNVPLPTFWGGFRIEPSRIEFWQGHENRLHDRIVYKLIDGAWIIERLSP
jgi:pyridoxamine 5'-phosphate oxidase